jgi:hypothetical protein
VVSLAGALAERASGRPEVVIASLARAGTPIGVLLRRALERMGVAAPHYSLSIIRDRGIDARRCAHRRAHDPRDVVFVDGWTGKGTITRELQSSLADRPLGFAPFLAVIADPAGCADLAPSDEDYLIPSGLLNAIVSGLVSRSVLNAELVGPAISTPASIIRTWRRRTCRAASSTRSTGKCRASRRSRSPSIRGEGGAGAAPARRWSVS